MKHNKIQQKHHSCPNILEHTVGKQSEAVTPVNLHTFLDTVTSWLQIWLSGGRALGSRIKNKSNHKQTDTTWRVEET